ncbi:MAG: hypothetical protein ACR2PR_09070 [Pseudohongiellaceae bacterium]
MDYGKAICPECLKLFDKTTPRNITCSFACSKARGRKYCRSYKSKLTETGGDAEKARQAGNNANGRHYQSDRRRQADITVRKCDECGKEVGRSPKCWNENCTEKNGGEMRSNRYFDWWRTRWEE